VYRARMRLQSACSPLEASSTRFLSPKHFRNQSPYRVYRQISSKASSCF
jgi:hypothetical protein